MPKISVLTPLYKTNPEHLKEMLESILSQSFRDFEFLLLNDSPECGYIKETIESYNDKRVIYIENEKNMGISYSRNRLLDMSKGEYIAIFDHDDISLPQRLEKESGFLDNNSDTGVVSSFAYKINKKSKITNPINNIEIKKELVIKGCVILHTGAMIRKSVLVQNNIRWEEAFSPCEDYMMWARLIDKTMFYNIEEPLVIYRSHEGNTSHLQKEKMLEKECRIKNYLWSKYPYFSKLNSSRSSIKLFGFIPFITIEASGNKIKYKLFDIITLIKILK